MTLINPYPGVNPHLNSALQSPGSDWDTFHFSFMTMLGDDIDSRLPPDYYLVDAASLQNPGHADEPPAEAGFTALMIKHIAAANPDRLMIVRIELLHPATKSSQERIMRYRNRRAYAHIGGYRTLEIDLLHEISPLDNDAADYSQHQVDAAPYNITFIDQMEGAYKRYAFGLQDALPVIQVPLQRPFLDTEPLLFSIDLNPAYRKTLESRRLLALLTDYTREPERIDTYSEADQAYIRQTIQEIKRGAG